MLKDNKIQGLIKPIFSTKVNNCNERIEKNSTGFATVIFGGRFESFYSLLPNVIKY